MMSHTRRQGKEFSIERHVNVMSLISPQTEYILCTSDLYSTSVFSSKQTCAGRITEKQGWPLPKTRLFLTEKSRLTF